MLVAAAIVGVLALDSASTIDGYRVLGDRTIAVMTTEGTNAWTRIASIDETPTTVTIVVRSFRIQLGAGTGVGILVESIVSLREPLGQRAVIDGRTGTQVARRPTSHMN